MKILHEFTQKVGTENVKEYTIKLKDLSRRERENFEVVYNAEYGKALAKGLAPHSTLRKSAIDAGGLLAKQDIERADELYRAVIEKSNEKQLKILNGETDFSEIDDEIQKLWEEYQEYEKPATLLYFRSAEFEAEKNAITWAVLNFTFVESNGKDVELFPGGTDGSRLDYYYECLESEKELEKNVFDKSYLCFHAAIKSSEKLEKDFFDALILGSDK